MLSDNSKALTALGTVIITFVIILSTVGYVSAQTTGNVTLTTQTSPTPVIQTTQPIATEDDVFNQFLTNIGVTGTGIAAGVGTLWAKVRNKTKRIDQALRGADFDNRDLIEVLNSFFEAAKNNPEKTPGQLLLMPAYKDKVLLQKLIGEAWGLEYDEYMEWFNGRYMVNKE